jgi:transposase
LKESCRQPLISREEIRAVYRQGEDAVIALVEGLLAQIESLNAKIVSLEARITSLEEQQSKNSRNSSKPPSGDGFGKRPQSLRQKSQRSSGGQIDPPGQTLEWRDSVAEGVALAVEQCQGASSS